MEEYTGERKPSMAKAVIIGGLVGGILGTIPPIFYGNCCCCLWYALGGVIAVLIYRAVAPLGLTAGTGGLLGLISGAVAGIISTIGLFLIFRIPFSNPDLYDPNSEQSREMESALRGFYERMGVSDYQIDEIMDQYNATLASMSPETIALSLLSILAIIAVIGIIFSVIAGMITAAVAGKQTRYPDEPPPYEPIS